MSDGGGGTYPTTEQEEAIQVQFAELNKVFKRIARTNKPDKIHEMMKDIANRLKECKILVKDFEREARTEGMPAPLLAERKRALVSELNAFIAKKKELGTGSDNREALLGGAAIEEEQDQSQMTTQQLMKRGRKEMQETDAALARAERIVEDTLGIGTQTAAALNDQTNQLNKIVDDLNEMEFTMKKASKVVRDITRGMLTDKCIGALLFLCIAGLVAVVVVKIVNPKKSEINDALNITGIVDNLVNQTTDGIGQVGNAAINGASGAANAASGAAGNGRRRNLAVRALFRLIQSCDDLWEIQGCEDF